MRAIVPAAGEGTRLRPLTVDTPKPLLEVGGEPILGRLLALLADHDIEAVTVITGYRDEAIVDRFGTQFRDMPISYVVQEQRRGLGHAVVLADDPAGPVAIVNGDNVYAPDTVLPLDRIADPAVDGVVLVEKASRSKATTTGVVTVDDSWLTGLVEKPTDLPSSLITTGVSVMPPRIVEYCRNLTPTDGELELTDAINQLVADGACIRPVRFEGERVNVNRPRYPSGPRLSSRR
ncbi:MAG: nucleotidyltransferase family protein [Natrialbaceae archaeon]|nr:nucleotidyltransferase family protein [Natrialbaceae archaeon]